MDLPKVTGGVASAERVPRSSDSLARNFTFKPKARNLDPRLSLPAPPQATWLGGLTNPTGEVGRGCDLSPGLQKHRFVPLSHASFHPTPIALGSPISFLLAFASGQPCRWGLSREAKGGGEEAGGGPRRAKAPARKAASPLVLGGCFSVERTDEDQGGSPPPTAPKLVQLKAGAQLF